MNKIFLHVGLPKTGSTSIQSFFYENYDVLVRHGILYPKNKECCGTIHHNNLLMYYRSSYVAYHGHEGKQPALDALRAEMKSSNCHSVILSHEMFWNADMLQEFKDDFSDFEVFVVFFLRRQDHFFESLYNQAIKTKNFIRDQSLFIVYYERYLDYFQTVCKWRDVFGKDKLTIIPLNAAKKKSAIDLFLERLNVNSDEMEYTNSKANISLHTGALDYIKSSILPSQLLAHPRVQNFFANYTKRKSQEDVKTYAFPQIVRKRIVDQYREGNNKIATTFLSQESLFDDMLPEPDNTQTASCVSKGVRTIYFSVSVITLGLMIMVYHLICKIIKSND